MVAFCKLCTFHLQKLNVAQNIRVSDEIVEICSRLCMIQLMQVQLVTVMHVSVAIVALGSDSTRFRKIAAIGSVKAHFTRKSWIWLRLWIF